MSRLGTGYGIAEAVGNGGWESGGYASNLSILPSKGIVITVMTNTSIDPVANMVPIAQALDTSLDH